MTPRSEAEAILRAAAGRPDDAVDLTEAALAFAALDRPGVPLDRYRRHLDALAAEVALAHDTADAGVAAKLAALASVIAGKHGYVGDDQTYDDLQNANLIRVIDRRKGLPVALGILYLAAGRAQGWDVAGLRFPGHFVLRFSAAGERVMFDPFNGGQPVATAELRALLKAAAGLSAELDPAHYTDATNREILLRLQNNIKVRMLQTSRVEPALRVVEDMLLFAPDEVILWREAAMLHASLGNLRAAITALQTFQDLATDAAARHDAALLLQQLRSKLN